MGRTDSISFTTLAELKEGKVHEGVLVSLMGITAIGDITPRFYHYVKNSELTSDDINVIDCNKGGQYLRVTGTPKRIDIYEGDTNGSGMLNIVFDTSFTEVPIVNITFVGAQTNQYARLVSVDEDGCSIHAYEIDTDSLLGIDILTTGISNINNATLNITVIER